MFKDNMRYYRKARKLSQQDIADRLGYKSFTTIQKWEDGTATPPYSKLSQLADILGVELKELMGDDYKVNSIPVLGTVRGGEPIFAEENIKDYETADTFSLNSDEYFCLDVIGDSMKNVRILPGDRLFVHRQNTLENREIGVILIGDEATVKRVIYQDDKMILQPENENYDPIVLTEEDQKNKGICILGKVVYNKIHF